MFPAISELGARDSAGSGSVYSILATYVDGDNLLNKDDLADMCLATLDGTLLDTHSALGDQVENMAHLQICHRKLGGMPIHQMEACLHEFMVCHKFDLMDQQRFDVKRI